jgi:hypothetical protein
MRAVGLSSGAAGIGQHDTYAAARADAAKIAAAHHERIIDDAREDMGGAA